MDDPGGVGGVERRGHVADDREHMVSAVDFLPTLLEIIGAPHPEGLDGRSFAPLVRGQSQTGREMVFKEYNENAGGSRDPMRGVQTKRFLYLFNAWSDGERVMRTATQGTSTYRRMKALARTNPEIAAPAAPESVKDMSSATRQILEKLSSMLKDARPLNPARRVVRQ